jgi:hypothetical protein
VNQSLTHKINGLAQYGRPAILALSLLVLPMGKKPPAAKTAVGHPE